jgi:beta-galactosidase
VREVRYLDDGWRFVRDDVGARTARAGSGAWEAVTLPHTWNAVDGYAGGGEYHRGRCWYARDLDVGPVDGRRVVVEFGAAGMVADVFVGERHLGTHRGGYSIFRFDLTDALDADGRGTLVVAVDNGAFDDVYPIFGDHTFFGGLYRRARLVTVPEVHVDLLCHGSPGVLVSQVSLTDDEAVVSARVPVRNAGGAAATVTLVARVVDGREVVAGAETTVAVAPGECAVGEVALTVARPHRWDGRADPHLYEMVVTLDGDADEVCVPFGLRTFEVDPDRGPRLNGRPYPLHGASRHQDSEGKGPALLAEDHERDLALFEELGVTAIRLAHYQHDQCFYDLCDRAGIAVWAEIPFNAQAATDDPDTNALEQMTELLHQCMHHPSILCWGVQNEITLGEARRDPRATVAKLSELARAVDPSRPTAQANLGQVTAADPIHGMVDLDALNLYCGWYYGTSDQMGPSLDELHEARPELVVGLSEYGADAYVGYHSSAPAAGDYTEEYQALLHEEVWRAVAARPYVWVSFVWNMFDFASAGRHEGGQSGRNMKGLVTYDRRTKKDAFYWYKANWSDEPFVHVCSKRFVHRHESPTLVRVYSNQPEVRLEVDGVDLGPGAGPDHVFEWTVDLDASGTTVRAVAAGAPADEATFVRVTVPDQSYVCPAPSPFGGRTMRRESWYEKEGLTADPSIYSTWTAIGELMENPETRAVLVEVVGPPMFGDAPDGGELARGAAYSLDFVAGFVPDVLTEEKLRELHTRLSGIPKPVHPDR